MVQGLTEFLPVSSSAHLILTRAFFGWDADAAFGLAFDVACHVGTLTAVVAYFRTDLLAMARSIPETFAAAPGPDGRRIRLIVIGTIPVVLVGAFVWSDGIATATRTPLVAAIALIAGAGLLLAIERIGSQGRGEEALGPGGAFAIGVAQAAALVPGVSRSGATIADGHGAGTAARGGGAVHVSDEHSGHRRGRRQGRPRAAPHRRSGAAIWRCSRSAW